MVVLEGRLRPKKPLHIFTLPDAISLGQFLFNLLSGHCREASDIGSTFKMGEEIRGLAQVAYTLTLVCLFF